MKKLRSLKIEIALNCIFLGIGLVQLMLGSLVSIILVLWMYRWLWKSLFQYGMEKNPEPIYYLYEPDSQRKAMIY